MGNARAAALAAFAVMVCVVGACSSASSSVPDSAEGGSLDDESESVTNSTSGSPELTGTEQARMLGQLLLTDQDFADQSMDVRLDGDTFPITEDHRDYSAPSEAICPEGDPTDPLGAGAVFSPFSGHDAYVGGAEWIAGEPAAMAIDRFEATSEVMDTCAAAPTEPAGESAAVAETLDLSHPGVSDIRGLRVHSEDGGEFDLVYARRDGLTMLLYLGGQVDPDGYDGWFPEEKEAIIQLALDKLAAADRTEWPIAVADEVPSIATTDPGKAVDVAFDDASCEVDEPFGTVDEATSAPLPAASPAAILWQVDGSEAFDSDTLPNDAADAGIAYGVDRFIVFLDPQGRELWRWESAGLMDVDIADKVYVVTRDRDDDQALVALSEESGEPVWAVHLEGGGSSWSSVDVIGGSVYLGGQFQSGGSFGPTLAVFDSATGGARWTAHAAFLGGNDNVALLDALPDQTGAACSLVAVDARSGELLWGAAPSPEPVASVTVGATLVDREVYVAYRPTSYESAGTSVVTVNALDAATGNAKWTQVVPWDSAYPSGRIWMIASEAELFVQASMGDYFNAETTVVAALDRADGEVSWSVRLDALGYVHFGLQQLENELLIPAYDSVIHLSTSDGMPTKVETVPFEWNGELIVTSAGPMLLSLPAVAAVQAS